MVILAHKSHGASILDLKSKREVSTLSQLFKKKKKKNVSVHKLPDFQSKTRDGAPRRVCVRG